ncbi:hypothetical protein [Corynebacterium sp. Marseille-P4321]|uniref:hypothetical protein n=1 Tax=Corynebacterium sp. Marseille-P4321 TaxID=2736603 RepID=UPI00158914E1|nr:hypothetical protein [Corynebacterium sp. Marseille-P4321]
MKKLLATITAAAALVAGTGTATAWSTPWNPGGVEWPAAYRQLPKQAPYATFSNVQNTARCGVYNINGQDFVQCISLVDRMPGHQCNAKYGEANAMNSVTWDAWNCLPKNTFAGAAPMGNLQMRRYGSQVVFTDHRGNFYIGDRGLNRMMRVGEINDMFIQDRKVTGFNSPIRGSSIPRGSSL